MPLLMPVPIHIPAACVLAMVVKWCAERLEMRATKSVGLRAQCIATFSLFSLFFCVATHVALREHFLL